MKKFDKNQAIEIYGQAIINRLLTSHCQLVYKSDAHNPDEWAASMLELEGEALVAWYTFGNGAMDDEENYELEFIEVQQ